MTFEDASKYIIPFGDFKGRTIDSIAGSDEGLLWLDRVQDWKALWPQTRDAIRAYLAHESIQRELAEAIRKEGR